MSDGIGAVTVTVQPCGYRSIGEMPVGYFWARPGAFDEARDEEERVMMAKLAFASLQSAPVPNFNEWLPVRRLMC